MVPIARESRKLRLSSCSRRASQTLLVESWPKGQAATQTVMHVPTSCLWYNVKAKQVATQTPAPKEISCPVVFMVLSVPPLATPAATVAGPDGKENSQ